MNSLVSSCPGLFLGAEGRADSRAARAVFSLIVAASTVFCRLKLLPPLPVTVPPVTAVAWLWFVVLPGLGAPPKKQNGVEPNSTGGLSFFFHFHFFFFFFFT